VVHDLPSSSSSTYFWSGVPLRTAVDGCSRFGHLRRFRPGNRGNPCSSKDNVILRCHWVPYHVPMDAALAGLDATDGLYIISARYDEVQDSIKPYKVRTAVRTVWAHTDDLEKIPHILPWSYGKQKGLKLVTVKGRPTLCSRCRQTGHLKATCMTPKCAEYGHEEPSCSNNNAWS
jgi:hypothetical protein